MVIFNLTPTPPMPTVVGILPELRPEKQDLTNMKLDEATVSRAASFLPHHGSAIRSINSGEEAPSVPACHIFPFSLGRYTNRTSCLLSGT
jgi:hypothetical protein